MKRKPTTSLLVVSGLIIVLCGCRSSSPAAQSSSVSPTAPRIPAVQSAPASAAQINQQNLNKAGRMLGAMPGVNQNGVQNRLNSVQNHLNDLSKQVNQMNSSGQ